MFALRLTFLLVCTLPLPAVVECCSGARTFEKDKRNVFTLLPKYNLYRFIDILEGGVAGLATSHLISHLFWGANLPTPICLWVQSPTSNLFLRPASHLSYMFITNLSHMFTANLPSLTHVYNQPLTHVYDHPPTSQSLTHVYNQPTSCLFCPKAHAGEIDS